MSNASDRLKAVVQQRASDMWVEACKIKAGSRICLDSAYEPALVLRVTRDDSLQSTLGSRIRVVFSDGKPGVDEHRSTIDFYAGNHVAEFDWDGERVLVTAIAVEDGE